MATFHFLLTFTHLHTSLGLTLRKSIGTALLQLDVHRTAADLCYVFHFTCLYNTTRKILLISSYRIHPHFLFILAQQHPLLPPSPPVGQGLIIREVSRSHSDTPQSVGLLWTGDQLVAETSPSQHTKQVSRSHSDTPQSVGLLWTGDQLVAETSPSQHT